MKYILTDIEGTTTSISFVHDVLFPFAKKHLKDFVASHLDEKNIQDILAATKQTALEENAKTLDDHEAVDLLIHWIDTDRKHSALKILQGFIWAEGYASGEIKGHIYKDVLPALLAWKEAGIILGVYSSGSVQAQHLIFEFSDAGDLRPYFTQHFDTNVGHKREVQSYVNIAKELELEASDILFLSDIKEELDAARTAGMKTIQLVRQSDVIVGDHKTAANFSEIKL